MRQTFFGVPKSMTGAGLAALGVFILYDNLRAAAVRLDHLLGVAGGQAPGAVPMVLLAVARLLHAYAAGHQRFVAIFFRHVLLSCWPLVLIVVGTVWSRNNAGHCGMEKGTPCALQKHLAEKNVVRVDFSTRRSTCR